VKPYRHAAIAAKRYGGRWEDYVEVHTFFDSSKAAYPGHGHRMFLHNPFGLECAERVFGRHLVNSDGLPVPVERLGLDHCVEDVGRMVAVGEWLDLLPTTAWEGTAKRRKRTARLREDPLSASAELWGGTPEDYRPLLEFLDLPVVLTGGNPRGRLLSWNSFGAFLAERALGWTIALDGGGRLPTRQAAEDWILAKWGFIPSLQDVSENMKRDSFVRGRMAGDGIRRRKHEEAGEKT